ncbi:phosphatase PAP2 family protein [Candidatus Saccharibacteria bacterium]|nr:phosphatase PAP2 family protein [Candidatus Saccharibacteria bacterium]
MDSITVFCAKYLFVFVVILFAWAWFKAPRKLKKQMIVAVVLAGVIAAVLDKLAGGLYYDPRPFVTHNVTPLVAHAADNGFPSEHTLFTFTIATVLYFYRPKLGYLAFGLALLVGIGRVAAHVHSPIDIIGGIAIGLISGWCGYQLAKMISKKHGSRAGAKT